MSFLKTVDPDIWELIQKERDRQEYQLEMIASENLAHEAIMEAEGSYLMNKYAEGYPEARYYGGCTYVDEVEKLAIERVKMLFGAEHANVQPHSGTQANMAVYFAVLNPGDTILSMNLSHGGHLSHGAAVNFSGKLYKIVHYGVSRETETIDYEEVRRLALEHRPKLIVAGASAYPRTIDFEAFYQIAQEVGAFLMVDMAHIAGLVAAGIHPSPLPYADFVTSTTHKTLRGPRGGFILCKEKFAKIIDKTVFPGIQGGPHMNVIAAKAVCFKQALEPEFKSYQQQVVKNAKTIAEVFKAEGFRIVTGGTDNHLILVDVSVNGLTGAEAEKLLEEAGITVNKNAIPFDPRPPRITSGIRIGTPAITTRGLKEKEVEEVAHYMCAVLKNPDKKGLRKEIRQKIREICERFPFYKR
ncbi:MULTISPECIES: serine hydroxymethyltransferase [Thermodesulfobacterium]|jgi:glycine hydroxymethyltransferase|uniref:Serine hydroxymethyltransferase n=2 Tax=Thermodesulfobacterium commune TaxID=1741 RepID=A0A075WUY2_9BACT|nr:MULTISPECIES: serine hydroxymethyltransferase [Thermodesulfobacterium]KUJ97697.1 MAG: Serine hydroxymethyltransferase [Thermodesulfobacterium sp. 37_54]KUK19547.1 MAG: Serine hydroxymethyltransferase [Thermodesulfobacterium commune]AIH04248.1 serine hydroxymethyltransferase [Thermodesulfobacterium commune DSM 2178]KUK37714.1 MAG: Serine hydroxymethyltransferase [Thermodesulfobacterium commune]MBZ4682501.1 serine hydroxymethyltransferase [Thermodesulfobacterium sp.]